MTQARRSTKSAHKASTRANGNAILDLTREIAALATMDVGELKRRYEEVFHELSRSNNKDFLRKKVAYRIQELAQGGLSTSAQARIAELAKDSPLRHRAPRGWKAPTPPASAKPRDPRLPPLGTILTREFGGRKYEVRVLAEGFVYDGKQYASLSPIANAIAGTKWNGLIFFGLQPRSGSGAAA